MNVSLKHFKVIVFNKNADLDLAPSCGLGGENSALKSLHTVLLYSDQSVSYTTESTHGKHNQW